MPLDPARVEDTKAWLAKAKKDLEAANHGLTASPPLLEDVTFHSQQASEKALKGFLAWHDIPFRKTHNIEEIGEASLAVDQTLKDIVDKAVPLTEYAWRFRYPGEASEPSRDEAEAALSLAHELYEAILSRVPEEASPSRRHSGNLFGNGCAMRSVGLATEGHAPAFDPVVRPRSNLAGPPAGRLRGRAIRTSVWRGA